MNGIRSIEEFMTDAMIQALKGKKEEVKEERKSLELKRLCESEDVKYLRA